MFFSKPTLSSNGIWERELMEFSARMTRDLLHGGPTFGIATGRIEVRTEVRDDHSTGIRNGSSGSVQQFFKHF